MRLVLVEWEDASTEEAEGPWVFTADAKPIPATVFAQVGWLFSETPDQLELTVAVDHEGKVMARRDRIPRGMVRSITDLAPAQAPPKRARK